MSVEAVHPWKIPQRWPTIYQMLKKAIDRGGEHTERSVLQALVGGSMVLWDAGDAYIVTTWCDYPAGRIGFVMFAGGSGTDWLPELENELVRWAFDIGCKEIRFAGRLGWGRLVDGLEKDMMYTRKL